MVGAVRFELTTSWTRTKRASQATLRPDIEREILPAARLKGNVKTNRFGSVHWNCKIRNVCGRVEFKTLVTEKLPPPSVWLVAMHVHCASGSAALVEVKT